MGGEGTTIGEEITWPTESIPTLGSFTLGVEIAWENYERPNNIDKDGDTEFTLE